MDNYVGSSLRYYYYIANSRGLFTPGIKNPAKMFSDVLMQARDWGKVPWDAITDDSRPIGGNVPEYLSKDRYVELGIDHLRNAHIYYTLPRWFFQPVHFECWLEKISLKPKFENVLEDIQIAIPVQKGYSSGGSLNKNQKRIKSIFAQFPHKQRLVIHYWGDWNGSGSDIERNVIERLHKFGIRNVEFTRIALNHEQIDGYNLPTAPAKESDTRTTKWVKQNGGDNRTTDLDAFVALDHIRPEKPFRTLLRKSIEPLFDEDIYQRQLEFEQKEREKIGKMVRKRVRFLDDN